MNRPSSIRFAVAGLLTIMACLLYLDRYVVGIASESIRVNLKMTQSQMSWFLSAFFWSYALCQVPAGWLSDRFGPRRMLTFYILGWSLFTGLLGVATQVSMVPTRYVPVWFGTGFQFPQEVEPAPLSQWVADREQSLHQF